MVIENENLLFCLTHFQKRLSKEFDLMSIAAMSW